MHGGALYVPPLLCFFCPLFKFSLGIQYMKILSKFFVADAHIKNSYTPSQSTLKYGSENRPCMRGLKNEETATLS